MQSTWYLFPGQTKKNTKISDRGKALIATPAAWNRITSHLETRKLQKEAQEQERARRQYLKDASYQMTKDWDNSIEKIRQRRLEELENKKKIKEEDQLKRFLQLRKEQEEERNNYVTEAKKKIYMFQEKSRNLNSALLLSEVLFERNLQQEFEKLEAQHETIENAQYAQCVRENAEREKEENQEKRKRIKEQNEKYTQELEVQIKKIQDEQKQELEERLKWEKMDNVKADEEMKAIKEYEKKLEVDKKADVRKQFNEFAAVQKQHKEQVQKQDEAENKIIQIYEKAKCRIDEKRKQRDKEVKEEKIRIREKIAAKVMAEAANNQELEDKMLAKAKEEYDKRENEKLQKEECYQKELRKQRAENREQVIARREKQAEEEVEVKKWELLNRLKTNEVMQKYDANKRQKEFDEKIEYRKELFDQMAELEKGAEYEKKCKDMELEYYKKKLMKEDKEFFAYADEVLELAQSRGRNIEPILKVVQQYKVENELEPKKKNRSMLQSNVPINKKPTCKN